MDSSDGNAKPPRHHGATGIFPLKTIILAKLHFSDILRVLLCELVYTRTSISKNSGVMKKQLLCLMMMMLLVNLREHRLSNNFAISEFLELQ